MKKHITHRISTIALVIILLSIIFLLFSSCNKNNPEPQKTANEYVYAAFQEWYLWNDQLPEINPNNYENIGSLIDVLRVEQDRWSFAGSYTEIKKLFESGEFKGFGGGFIIDFDKKIKITHVYNNSPMGREGVKRGWIVESVNKYTVDQLDKVYEGLSSEETVEFVFSDFSGTKHNICIQKESFQMNTVLYSQVYNYPYHKIGYLVFNSFTNSSEDELKKSFEIFKSENCTDLIVDLRYNGGGTNNIANMLVGMIGGEKVKNQVISNMIHNNKNAAKNNTTISNYEGVSLNIDKVYFITTTATASASELVINNLSPFMEVKLVGSNTHGKPVGMYVLPVEEINLAILPICFKMTNSNNFGEYFNGLQANIDEFDDLAYDWGNIEEAMLKAAIKDINEQTIVISSDLKSTQISEQKLIEYKGINHLINTY